MDDSPQGFGPILFTIMDEQNGAFNLYKLDETNYVHKCKYNT